MPVPAFAPTPITLAFVASITFPLVPLVPPPPTTSTTSPGWIEPATDPGKVVETPTTLSVGLTTLRVPRLLWVIRRLSNLCPLRIVVVETEWLYLLLKSLGLTSLLVTLSRGTLLLAKSDELTRV